MCRAVINATTPELIIIFTPTRDNYRARAYLLNVRWRVQGGAKEGGWGGSYIELAVRGSHCSLVNAFCRHWSAHAHQTTGPMNWLSDVFGFCKEGVVLDYHLDCLRVPPSPHRH